MKTINMLRSLLQRLLMGTVASFTATFLLCSIMIAITLISKSNVETLTMERLIMEKSISISNEITRLMYKTNALAVLAMQSEGDIEDFEKIATILVDDSSIHNVLIAPGCVVEYIYPREGNEKMIGFDFSADSVGNREAMLAVETGELVLGGPFELAQGGMGLVGRQPVYKTNENGEPYFWGLVSVTLKHPDVFEREDLSAIEKERFVYELWRINPDTQEKQIIIKSGEIKRKNARYIEESIQILNAEWYCRITPIRSWYQYLDVWILALVSLMVCFFVSYIARNNFRLEALKCKMENLARTDALTGISNRRCFVERAAIHQEIARRSNRCYYIIMIDLDHFKQVNDSYGHLAGDETLKAVVTKIRSMLRPYDLLARYGGEEFIVLLTDSNKEDALSVAERIRKAVSEVEIYHKGHKITITSSLGIAEATPADNIDTIIEYADFAMYKAKTDGRNKVVFYGD